MTYKTWPRTETTADTHAAPYLRAIDNLEQRVVTVFEPVSACPRCTGPSIVALGDAHSSVEWFHCRRCDHVWASKVAIAPLVGPAPRFGLLRLVSRAHASLVWALLLAALGRRATGA